MKYMVISLWTLRLKLYHPDKTYSQKRIPLQNIFTSSLSILLFFIWSLLPVCETLSFLNIFSSVYARL